MNINIFEGARRIALALGGLFAVGCLAYAALSETYVSLSFTVAEPGAQPVQSEGCERDDAWEYLTSEIAPGRSIRVNLCFTAHEADDGRMLIPFAVTTQQIRLPDGTVIQNVPTTLSAQEIVAKLKANGYDVSQYEFDVSKLKTVGGKPWEPQRVSSWRMNEKYSSDVTAYTRGVAKEFKLKAQDRTLAEQRLSAARLKQWKDALQVLFGVLFVGWVFSLGVGWIVRGFMGIPRRQDRRPAPQTESSREAT